MDYKTNILKLMKLELDQIIRNYEETVEVQKKEIMYLNNIVQEKDLEISRLQNELMHSKSPITKDEKMPIKIIDENVMHYEVRYEDIDKLSISQKEGDLVFVKCLL